VKQNYLPIILPLVTILLVLGCSDDRAVEISREAADRQAAQNQEMAHLNREVTTAHRELTELQQGVQEERSDLNTGWDDLESERQQIANDRRTESFLAALVPVAGTVVVIVSVIYFAGLLLRTAHAPEAIEAELCQMLVTELAADEPQFLPLRRERPETLLTHTPQETIPLESHRDDPDPNP
jgi:hypothetical protein